MFSKENRLFLYLLIIILTVLFISAYANKWSSKQSIQSFIITGNKFIPTEELLGNVDSALIDCSRDELELLDLKDKIVKHPFVMSSFVMQKGANSIEIEINERKPVAILIKNDGSLCYSDFFGNILPYRLSLKFCGLPVLRNFFVNGILDSAGLKDAIEILKEIRKPEFAKISSIISEIEYQKGSFNFISSDYSYPIIFGCANNIKVKLEILDDFYNNAFFELDAKDIRYVDVRWNERIIVQTNSDYLNTLIQANVLQ
ncbi:hypothetical protein D9V86_02815 [Bacteroidetes/Chlorobi group bacterium ChocPot_Mid]|nr:MAG: hypothetical protein D9V86_02815 [Bacteroidetes/Chlorobi group bacterium ChocPot_Mid]